MRRRTLAPVSAPVTRIIKNVPERSHKSFVLGAGGKRPTELGVSPHRFTPGAGGAKPSVDAATDRSVPKLPLTGPGEAAGNRSADLSALTQLHHGSVDEAEKERLAQLERRFEPASHLGGD